MRDVLRFDVAGPGARICPACDAAYGPRSRYARDRARVYCYRSGCAELEIGRGLVVSTPRSGVALLRRGGRYVGKVTRYGTSWAAWNPEGEFIGWGARRRDAVALF